MKRRIIAGDLGDAAGEFFDSSEIGEQVDELADGTPLALFNNEGGASDLEEAVRTAITNTQWLTGIVEKAQQGELSDEAAQTILARINKINELVDEVESIYVDYSDISSM